MTAIIMAYIIKNIISLIRPEQWIKNLFVIAPAFFAGKITSPTTFTDSIIAAISFCLISSSVYCFNDIFDAASDRKHPVKCNRPIASRAISPVSAAILSCILALGAFLLAGNLDVKLIYLLGTYLGINILYTLFLKRFSIIDITIISFSFILRLLVGSISTDCFLSPWIVIVTFLLSLFLALGKRREEVSFYIKTGTESRVSVTRYSLKFIDSAMTLTAASIITSYFIYAAIPNSSRTITSEYFYLTGLPVTIGILRYLQICVDENSGGTHHRLLINDSVIIWCIIVYLTFFFFFMYGESCCF